MESDFNANTAARLTEIKALLRQAERGEVEGFPSTEEAIRRLQAEIVDLGGEPWCNHDPVAVVNGVCECGVRVAHPPFCTAFVKEVPCPKEWGHDNGVHHNDGSNA